ncbi:hypothetical protein FA95DRAFT_1478523, partial [Auriscalpium vulgare]
PFADDPRADAVLRSSVGTRFRLSTHILSLASPVFADMFTIGRPSDVLAADALPIVDVEEDAATIDLLLRWCYPVRSPPLMTLENARQMAEVTQKYDIRAFDDIVQDAL